MKKLRVLIADDSALVRKSVRTFLQSCEECEICGDAADGHQALDRAKKLSPDVILLDLALPGLSGFQVVKALRAELPSVTIVIMSQQDPSLLRHDAETVSVEHFIPKSNLAHELVPLLQKLSSQ